MSAKEIKSWKKVYETDYTYLTGELKEILTTPAVIIVTGEVGVGKTTMIQRFLQDSEKTLTTSPTYSLLHDCGRVLHADFYRIEKQEEIFHLEIPLYLENKSYFFIEWGKPYLSTLAREIGEEHHYYELDFKFSEAKAQETSSRHITLYSYGQEIL